MRAQITVPLADPKGITFIEKYSHVLERDYETSASHVHLKTDISQRLLDQLPNNVPSAKVLKTATSPVSKTNPWRIRTKAIKELIPENFLESQRAEEMLTKTADLIPAIVAKRGGKSGLSIGNHRISP